MVKQGYNKSDSWKDQGNESVNSSFISLFVRKGEMLSHLEGKHSFVCGSTHCYSNLRKAESENINSEQSKDVKRGKVCSFVSTAEFVLQDQKNFNEEIKITKHGRCLMDTENASFIPLSSARCYRPCFFVEKLSREGRHKIPLYLFPKQKYRINCSTNGEKMNTHVIGGKARRKKPPKKSKVWVGG
jgi:hypothetical protein